MENGGKIPLAMTFFLLKFFLKHSAPGNIHVFPIWKPKNGWIWSSFGRSIPNYVVDRDIFISSFKDRFFNSTIFLTLLHMRHFIWKYLHFCQNTIPTMLAFAAISKLQTSKTNVSVKKNYKNLIFRNTKYVFQCKILLTEKPSEVRTIPSCLKQYRLFYNTKSLTKSFLTPPESV